MVTYRDPTKTGKTEILAHLLRRHRGDAGGCRPVILTSGKVRERVLLQAVSVHVKDQEVTGSTQHGLSEAGCA